MSQNCVQFQAAVLMAAASLLPSPGQASCILEPFQPQLESADVVYVGTIVASRLVRPLAEFRSGNPHRRPMVHHDVEPQIVLKGAPQVIPEIISASGYVDPTPGRFWEIAELMPVAPGDTLLIVGHAGKPVFVGLCSASRRWDAQTGKLVRQVFPDAP